MIINFKIRKISRNMHKLDRKNNNNFLKIVLCLVLKFRKKKALKEIEERTKKLKTFL
jgi:hypothetical protein